MSLQWDCVFGILRLTQGSAKKTNNEQFDLHTVTHQNGFTALLCSARQP